MAVESITKFVMPMLAMNWIFGIGVIEYPMGHQHFIITFLYNASCIIVYFYLFYYAHPHILRLARQLAVNENALKVLFYSRGFIFVALIFSGWRRNQGMRSIIKYMTNSDNLLEQIGVPKMYSKKFKIQLFKYLFAIIYISLIITLNACILLINEYTLEPGEIVLALIVNYSMIVTFIADFTFANLVNLASEKLKALNTSLRKLSRCSANYPLHAKIVKLHCDQQLAIQVRERSHVDQSNQIQEDVPFKLKTAKEAHVYISKLCREINDTFDLHILQSIAIGIGVSTVCLYETQAMLQRAKIMNKSIIYRIAWHSILWITYYSIKLFAFCSACSKTVEQSIITGDIISEIYDEPFIGEEAQAQIRNFRLNLISNDISFSVGGFAKLDFTLIQVVIGVISTYMMILVQFENFIIPTCTNSTCAQ